MVKYVTIEILVANALIENLVRFKKCDVDFATIIEYGQRIAKILESDAQNEVILLVSRRHQLSMSEAYSNFFEVNFSTPGNTTFKIKNGVSIEDLSNYFRWTMSTEYIKAFLSEEAISALGDFEDLENKDNMVLGFK